MELKKYICIVN